MRPSALALILEDDPAELATLMNAVREVPLEPLVAISPSRALHRLRYNRPVLAIVDPDIGAVPAHQAPVDDLLRRLFEERGGCFVLVYSVGADQIPERKRIEGIHPFAAFVAKQDGPRALVNRINRMLLGARFADLAVRGGLTTHEPTGEVFKHSVGVSLVLGAALGQQVVLQSSEAKAARRMRDWLQRIGSPVELADLGRRRYTLKRVRPADRAGIAGAVLCRAPVGGMG